MFSKVLGLLSACLLLVAACSSGGENVTAVAPTEDPGLTTSAPATTAAAPTPTLPDYAQQADGFVDAESDAQLPAIEPDNAAGAYGFSRYVYQQTDSEVVPTLIEGPRGYQYRCQDLEKDCSYAELQALYDEGSELPEYLGMTRDELGVLVEQLRRTEEAVMQYPTIEEACAAGLFANSAQAPNMGIHMNNPNGTRSEFDPARPTMLLFAKDGSEQLTLEEMGNCRDGEWAGEPGYVPVGAVFTLEMTDDHPDAFAGPIDNWHIHLNTCTVGAAEEGPESVEGFDTEVPIRQTIVDPDICAENGGAFLPIVPMWMMHAYVAPDFDPQGGVFAMYNPSVWPIANTPEAIRNLQTVEAQAGAVTAPITNFDFGDVTVDAGESIVFSNGDSVPHTVTAGTPGEPEFTFDSGLFGTGETYELSFDEAGEYDLFCVLHPQMTATVTVE